MKKLPWVFGGLAILIIGGLLVWNSRRSETALKEFRSEMKRSDQLHKDQMRRIRGN